jgi:hypothetical protein
MPRPIEVFMVRPQKLKRYRGALTDAKKENLQIALHELDKYGRMQVKKLQELAPEKKGLFLSGFTYSLKKSGPNLGELRVNWLWAIQSGDSSAQKEVSRLAESEHRAVESSPVRARHETTRLCDRCMARTEDCARCVDRERW